MKILIKKSLPRTDRQSYVNVTFEVEHDRTRFIEHAHGTALALGVKSLLPLTRRRTITLMRRIVKEAQDHEITRLVLQKDSLPSLPGWHLDAHDCCRLLAENAHMAAYSFTAFKKQTKGEYHGLQELVLLGMFTKGERNSLARGDTVAQEIRACRDLANMPGGDMTPKLLAQRIRKAAEGSGARVRVLSKADMAKLRMGAILGVARGAKEDPTFIIVEYWGGRKSAAPIVLAGKGVTFDSGGLSLKGADVMLDMHLDMSGGAAAAHAVLAAARMKLRVNAIALIPAVENAVSGESYRPGDVLRSMSGMMIDILNTDAEGRVILADALTYAKRYKPALVVDVATLTGASLVALGTKASAVLTPDDELATRMCTLGEVSGDYCWQLPLWEEYKGMVKGRFGDIANIPTKGPRYGGTIGGGMFLAEFAEGYPWVHIDIAPRMTSDEDDNLAPGATGVPVRLLVRLLEQEESR